MKYIRLLCFLFVTAPAGAQNFPACDSLVINCCMYNTFGPGTIELTVSNSSSVLFDYPSFALFNSSMDTVAKETVTYFGIGTSPQSHVMNVVMPFTLPFTGFLNLYTLFYDTLACSFPVTLPDTVTGILVEPLPELSLTIRPNPVDPSGVLHISYQNFTEGIVQVKIINTLGQEVTTTSVYLHASGTTEIPLPDLNPGLYILQVIQKNNPVLRRFQVL